MTGKQNTERNIKNALLDGAFYYLQDREHLNKTSIFSKVISSKEAAEHMLFTHLQHVGIDELWILMLSPCLQSSCQDPSNSFDSPGHWTKIDYRNTKLFPLLLSWTLSLLPILFVALVERTTRNFGACHP